jgi:uncharacterized membrane protein
VRFSMIQQARSSRRRRLYPSVCTLEGRALLNAAMPDPVTAIRVDGHVLVTKPDGTHDAKTARVSRHASVAKHDSIHDARTEGPDLMVLGVTGGYRFTNFDGPNAGMVAGTGTNVNGITNTDTVVGMNVADSGAYTNFTADPLKTRKTKTLNIIDSPTALAFGINSSGTVVGADGHGGAFTLSPRGVLKTFVPTGGLSATAFGINNRGMVVGQYFTSTTIPGFVRVRGNSYVTINAPSGPNVASAQGVNDKGLVVGFYVGSDGQDHGFVANARGVKRGTLTATAIADPVIPTVAGEPGATFMFSQILGINDKGIAVGYYGDSTGSQHGFVYDTRTGQYTFLDDPSEAFDNGVEVTQITGITNSGKITGFYSNASGAFDGFVATPHLR